MEEGKEYMRLMVSIYKLQVEVGRVFIHEHPAQARSWHMKKIQNRVNISRMCTWASFSSGRMAHTQLSRVGL